MRKWSPRRGSILRRSALEMEMGVPLAGDVHARSVSVQLHAGQIFHAGPAGVSDRLSVSRAGTRPIRTTAPKASSIRSLAGRWQRPWDPRTAGGMDGSRLPHGTEQAVRGIHRLGQPGGYQPHPCPPADCWTTCSSPSRRSPRFRRCASSFISSSGRGRRSAESAGGVR